MNNIENHPFGYFIPKKSTKLIIGSFPCFIAALLDLLNKNPNEDGQISSIFAKEPLSYPHRNSNICQYFYFTGVFLNSNICQNFDLLAIFDFQYSPEFRGGCQF
jgi:hypothetical protein